MKTGESRSGKEEFSDEQIIGVVKQLESGRTAAELAREVGVRPWTVYSWKAKYGGIEPSEAARLHQLPVGALGGGSEPVSRDAESAGNKNGLSSYSDALDPAFLIEQFAASQRKACVGIPPKVIAHSEGKAVSIP